MPLTVRTPLLEVAYDAHGPANGEPIVLLHGFPYDPRAFDEVAPPLGDRGYRVLVPYLRGYGPTRFLSPETPRSGQQAALGKDLLDFLDALELPKAALAGYDWGGRAACVVAALWPSRVRCLVTVGGYNIQDIARSVRPAAPEQEHRLWYQYYFQTERGRAGLTQNRYELCRLLWRLWSPIWQFSEATYAQTARSFENPDFVDVVIQSYRHRYAYAPGDPALESIEAELARQPDIKVPTISLQGADDGVTPMAPSTASSARGADEGPTPISPSTPTGTMVRPGPNDTASSGPAESPSSSGSSSRVTSATPGRQPPSGLSSPGVSGSDAPSHFTGPFQQRIVPRVGHNLPQEAPQAVVDALLELLQR